MQPQNQNNFTRGSQIFAHQLRMFSQGSINALIVGLVFTGTVDRQEIKFRIRLRSVIM